MHKQEIIGLTLLLAVLAGLLVAVFVGVIRDNKRKDAGQVRIEGWVNAEDAAAVLLAIKRANSEKVEK
jgi:hypothetical protein